MAGRSGSEPATARSPVRLRLALALFGVIVCLAVAVVAWSLRDEGHPTAMAVVGIVAVAAAVVAVIDLVVLERRLHRSR
jgi:Family of unknown function (DUF6343)